MKKRVLIFIMALVMLFSVAFFGAGTCEFSNDALLLYRIAELEREMAELEQQKAEALILETRKTEAINELRLHVGVLNQNAFDRSDWRAIEAYLLGGIASIVDAQNYESVGAVVILTKARLARFREISMYWRVLRDISEQFSRGCWGSGSVQCHGHSICIDRLSWELVFLNIPVGEFWHWGQFNHNSNVAVIANIYRVVRGSIENESWYETVSGIEFMTGDNEPIYVWHNGRFMSLSQAYYDYELLTRDDLLNIQQIHGAWLRYDRYWE